MLVDKIDSLRELVAQTEVEQIFEYIQTINLDMPKLAEWFVISDTCKALTLNRSNYSEGVFESHRDYWDFHIVIKGCDIISLGALETAISLSDYDEKLDFTLFRSVTQSETILNKGALCLIKPGELHNNRIESQDTIKVVIKLKNIKWEKL